MKRNLLVLCLFALFTLELRGNENDDCQFVFEAAGFIAPSVVSSGQYFNFNDVGFRQRQFLVHYRKAEYFSVMANGSAYLLAGPDQFEDEAVEEEEEEVDESLDTALPVAAQAFTAPELVSVSTLHDSAESQDQFEEEPEAEETEEETNEPRDVKFVVGDDLYPITDEPAARSGVFVNRNHYLWNQFSVLQGAPDSPKLKSDGSLLAYLSLEGGEPFIAFAEPVEGESTLSYIDVNDFRNAPAFSYAGKKTSKTPLHSIGYTFMGRTDVLALRAHLNKGQFISLFDNTTEQIVQGWKGKPGNPDSFSLLSFKDGFLASRWIPQKGGAVEDGYTSLFYVTVATDGEAEDTVRTFEEKLFKVPDGYTQVQVARDGSMIALKYGNSIRLIDTQTKIEKEIKVDMRSFNWMEFSPDSSILLLVGHTHPHDQLSDPDEEGSVPKASRLELSAWMLDLEKSKVTTRAVLGKEMSGALMRFSAQPTGPTSWKIFTYKTFYSPNSHFTDLRFRNHGDGQQRYPVLLHELAPEIESRAHVTYITSSEISGDGFRQIGGPIEVPAHVDLAYFSPNQRGLVMVTLEDSEIIEMILDKDDDEEEIEEPLPADRTSSPAPVAGAEE